MAHKKQSEHLKIGLEVIRSATNNFAEDNCIGKGGFGRVYKGEFIHDSKGRIPVAFKRLNIRGISGQGVTEFGNEIMLLSLYKHENIVSLLGYCGDYGEKILMYEYESKGSLDLYLNNKDLSWVQRLKICIGVARGLAYLHSPTQGTQFTAHLDVKSSNILLDENWEAKISDFGLSKLVPANKQFSFLVTDPAGTHGYCDPFYKETGCLTKESDVYSFGVVLFEVLCGRLCYNNNFTVLVRRSYEENTLNEIIFRKIKDQINPYSLKEFTKIAYQCLDIAREERPLMTKIVQALERSLKLQCLDAGSEGSLEAGIINAALVAGILNVKVLRGRKLKMKNPYVILKLSDSRVASTKKTSVKHKNVNPEWNEDITLYVEDLSTQVLEIWVQNESSVKKHHVVGMTDLKLSRLTPEELHTQTHNIHYMGRQSQVKNMLEVVYKLAFPDMGRSQGKIMLEVVYKPFLDYTIFEDACPLQKIPIVTPKNGGLLVVIIHEGKKLEEKHHSNPFVLLRFRGKSRKTVTMMNSNDPIWEEEFLFSLEEPPTDEKLHLEVISTSWRKLIYKEKESMGYADINLVDVVNKKRILKWYNLVNVDDGQIRVELQWRPSN